MKQNAKNIIFAESIFIMNMETTEKIKKQQKET